MLAQTGSTWDLALLYLPFYQWGVHTKEYIGHQDQVLGQLVHLHQGLYSSHERDSGGQPHQCPSDHPFAQSHPERSRSLHYFDFADFLQNAVVVADQDNCYGGEHFELLPNQSLLRLDGYLHYSVYANVLKESYHGFRRGLKLEFYALQPYLLLEEEF